MIIYNTTIKVSWIIHEAWLEWIQKTHIKEILETRCFQKHQLVRLLETDDEEGPTYAIQFYAAGKDDYYKYIENFADRLKQKSIDRWGDQFIAFNSLMQIVH